MRRFLLIADLMWLI